MVIINEVIHEYGYYKYLIIEFYYSRLSNLKI